MERNMVQATISNYIKNSDFTTQKQTGDFTMTLAIPAGTYDYGHTISTTTNVTAGVYFENITISTTLSPGEYYPTNYVVLMENQDSYIYVAVYQSATGQYKLQATLMGSGGTAQVTTGGLTVTAKVHLSISPFA